MSDESKPNFFRRQRERWLDLSETQRDVFRWMGGLAVLVVLAGAGWQWVRPWWRDWRRDRALGQAEAFAVAGDYRSTVLALRRATELAPDDADTWRQAVKYLAEIGSPETLVARERLTQLEPGDIGLRLAFVQEALRFRQYESAGRALDAVDWGARSDVAFHRLAAALALATGQTDALEKHLAAIVAARPDDHEAAYNLAAVRLWSSDPKVAAEAETKMDALVGETDTAVRAGLELLKLAARQRDAAKAARIATRLLARFSPGVKPDFSSEAMTGWKALLKGLEKAAEGTSTDVTAMARWLIDIGKADEARGWLEGLPAEIKAQADVLAVRAELAAGLNQMGPLDALLRDGAWGGLPEDVRLVALAVRVQQLRQPGRPETAALWGDAVALGSESEAVLRLLSRLASAWDDAGGLRQVLEVTFERFPDAEWAADALETHLVEAGDSAGLWSYYGRLATRRPADVAAAANWVRLGMILGKTGGVDYSTALRTLGASAESGGEAANLALAAYAWRRGKIDDAGKRLAAITRGTVANQEVFYWEAIVALARKDEATAEEAKRHVVDGQLTEAERKLWQDVWARVGATGMN